MAPPKSSGSRESARKHQSTPTANSQPLGAPSAPLTAVSLDPNDYFYPPLPASAWRLQLEQQQMASIHGSRMSLLDDDSADPVDSLADSLADPSSSFECFAFDSLPEKSSSKSSQKSSATKSSPRTTASSKAGLRSSAGAVKADATPAETTEEEEGPEMLVTAPSGLLGMIDAEMDLKSNIVAMKRKALSLSLDHEATAACINNRMGLSAQNLAKKVAVEPSNSCDSSQSPCNVTLTGLDMNLQAC